MAGRLALLLGILMCFGIAVGVLPPLLVAIGEEFRLSTLELGAINAIFGLSRMAIDLPMGHYLRRIGPVLALGAAFPLGIAGSLVTGWAGDYQTILVGRALVGAGTGILYIVVLTVLFLEFPRGVRGRVTGLYEATRTLSLAVGSVGAGSLAGVLGWRGIFTGAALMASLALVPAAVWVLRPGVRGLPAWGISDGPAPPLAQDVVAPGWPRRGTPVVRLVPVYAMAFLLAFCWGGVLMTLFPLYGGAALQLDVQTVGLALTLGYVLNLLLLFPAGWASDHLGRLQVLTLGAMLLALAIVLVPASAGAGLFLASGTLMGAGFSIWSQPPTLLVERTKGFAASTVVGMYRFVSDVGYVAGPVLLGLLATHLGHATALRLTAGGVLLTALGIVRTQR